jgi:predicted Zn-dependent protease
MHGPLLSLLLLTATAPAPQDDSALRSQRGKELMASGRYAEAATVYRELVAAVPGNPGLLLNLGMALHMAGRERDAVAPLESALRLQPGLMPAALFLGLSNLRLGRPESAIPPLEKAVSLAPENRDARSALVEALLAVERHPEAETHLRRLAEQAPSDPAVWLNLGNTYEALAAQAFEELTKQAPDASYAPALLAEASLEQGRRNAAFHLYREAMGADPPLRGLHTAVAGIYRAAGHAEWAAVEERREREVPPADCARDALECAFAAGKLREVASTAARSRTAAARYWLVRSYNGLARQSYARLTALPPSAQSHEWTARHRRHQRRYAESVQEWRRAIALAPGDPQLSIELALTLRAAGDLDAARKLLEELARAHPDSFEANDLLGDVLVAQQQPERAIPFLEKALATGPAQPHTHGVLGRAYALAGRPADAVRHLEKSLSADEDGSLRYQLARSYQALGRAEQARTALQDYEAFKKALEAEGHETSDRPLTPP